MASGTALSWNRSLADAIRDPDVLIDELGLPEELREAARQAASLFPLLVPRSYVDRMEKGNPRDPLLLQVLPLVEETSQVPGFVTDAVGDEQAKLAPGLLQKYEGRALLISTGACAVHCRYCFRRHYPYGEEPRRLDEWAPALEALKANSSIHEAILSGGDPWMLTDARLAQLLGKLAEIPSITRIRMHTRLPIVLPERVTDELLELCASQRAQIIVVVHANHPHEIAGDCSEALRRLVRAGLPVLNQAVLLRGINDRAEVLAELCERLINIGAIPYYLHQLDRVAGTAHFEVAEEIGLRLIEELRSRLPGYAVPRYVREIEGEPSKTPLPSTT